MCSAPALPLSAYYVLLCICWQWTPATIFKAFVGVVLLVAVLVALLGRPTGTTDTAAIAPPKSRRAAPSTRPRPSKADAVPEVLFYTPGTAAARSLPDVPAHFPLASDVAADVAASRAALHALHGRMYFSPAPFERFTNQLWSLYNSLIFASDYNLTMVMPKWNDVDANRKV